MPSRFHDVVVEKLNEFYESGVPDVFERDLSLGALQPPAPSNLVQVVVGVRRCGKTYRLFQEMHRILEAGYDLGSILYFNFDDDRLKPYETEVLQDVVESFFAMHPAAKKQGAFFFFDEVQEVPEWGGFMRRMVDTQKATIYVAGSSSKMLSLQLASEFRGRALSRELFPMSFAEFVRFHNYEIDPRLLKEGGKQADAASGDAATGMATVTAGGMPTGLTTGQRANLRHALDDYLARGGFIATQRLDAFDATQLLQEYANRAVGYDILERYNISNPRAASMFLARCVASSGRKMSINKVSNEFKSRGVSVGRDTLARLLAYFEESYLVFSVREFSVALADNPRSRTKVYATDPALFAAFSPAPSKDAGQRLETAVFNKLRREAPSQRAGVVSRAFVGEGSGRSEIDFVVGDAMAGERTTLVQVSVDVADDRTRGRELSALDRGMERFGVHDAWLVTEDSEGEFEVANGTVHMAPAWKWLL